jgi:hypothetical protein
MVTLTDPYTTDLEVYEQMLSATTRENRDRLMSLTPAEREAELRLTEETGRYNEAQEEKIERLRLLGANSVWKITDRVAVAAIMTAAANGVDAACEAGRRYGATVPQVRALLKDEGVATEEGWL